MPNGTYLPWWQGEYFWPGPSPSRCVLHPEESAFCTPTGLADAISRIHIFRGLACAYGCALMIPHPRALLDSVHNIIDGVKLPLEEGVRWDRYIQRKEGTTWEYEYLLEDIPPGKSFSSMAVRDRDLETSDLEDLVQRSQAGVELQMLNVGWSQEHRCNFYESHRDTFYRELAKGGPLHGQCKLPWPGRGHSSGQRSNEIAESLFGAKSLFGEDERIMRVHLRLGDRATQYPTGCTNVSTVAWNIKEKARKYQLTANRSICQLFIATDERDPHYLEALRSALQANFENVHLETDIAAKFLESKDNYFNYQVLSTFPLRVPNTKDAVWETELLNFRYHPSALVASGVVCNPAAVGDTARPFSCRLHPASSIIPSQPQGTPPSSILPPLPQVTPPSTTLPPLPQGNPPSSSSPPWWNLQCRTWQCIVTQVLVYSLVCVFVLVLLFALNWASRRCDARVICESEVAVGVEDEQNAATEPREASTRGLGHRLGSARAQKYAHI